MLDSWRLMGFGNCHLEGTDKSARRWEELQGYVSECSFGLSAFSGSKKRVWGR